MQKITYKQKLRVITSFFAILYLVGGTLQANAFGITPDPAEFTSTSTIFSYYTNAGEYGVQFRQSGYAQQYIGSNDSNTGTLQSQSGGEPVGTLNIVFLNDDTARQYCVENLYSDCLTNQSSYIIGQKQIVWLGAPTPTTTPTTTLSTLPSSTTVTIVQTEPFITTDPSLILVLSVLCGILSMLSIIYVVKPSN